MSVKSSVNYGKCSVFVLGMEMNCPMCGVLVKSGEQHQCSRPELKTLTPKKSRSEVLKNIDQLNANLERLLNLE